VRPGLDFARVVCVMGATLGHPADIGV